MKMLMEITSRGRLGYAGHKQTRSLFHWYRILRTRHAWTVFQAIRYALWLAR